MSRTILISDDLAAALERRRERDGFSSLDAAAEAVIAEGIVADDPHLDGLSIEQMRALIDDSDASGAEIAWDAAAARTEVLRVYAERNRRA